MLAEGGIRIHPDSARAIALAQTARTRHVRVAVWIMVAALGAIAASLF
jgi:hypothetical protein